MATEENDMSFPEAEVRECDGCCEQFSQEELDEGDGLCAGCLEDYEALCEECGEEEAMSGETICSACARYYSDEDEDEDEDEEES